MALSPLMQALNILETAVSAALDDHTISMEELGQARSFLSTTVSRINQYHNKFKTPIGKLPPETLGRILEFVVAPERDMIYRSSSVHLSKAYELALTVCKSWRTTALSWPRLWYHIVDEDFGLSDPGVLNPKAVFGRSGTTPLHVYAHIPPVERSNFPSIFCDASHRIQEAHLTIDETRITLEEILRSLSFPLPNVEFLTLRVPKPHLEVGESENMPRILGGISIHMRALALHSVPFVPGNAFPALVNLKVDNVWNDILTIRKLVRLLRHCPLLETFELTRGAPGPLLSASEALAVTSQIIASTESDTGSPDAGMPVLSPASLPRLRGLQLSHMHIDHALAVLALLQLPKHLALRLDNLQRSDYPLFADHPNDSPWPSFTTPPMSALYGVKGLTHLDIVATRPGDVSYANLHIIAHGEQSGIWFHIPGWLLDYTVLEHLTAHLDVQHVTTFRLSIFPEAIERLAFLRPLLMKLLSLSRLLIRCSETLSKPLTDKLLSNVEGALSPSSSPDGDAFEIPAPALYSLGMQMGCSDPPVDQDALARILASRAQSGHPIHSLECNISGTTQADLSSVTEYVEHLDVTSRPLVREISCNVPSVFKMKNDYWDLFCREDAMEGWALPEQPA